MHLILLGAVLVTCPIMTATSVIAAQLADNPPPVCELTTLDGAPVESLQSLKGKVVYVDFWASWCPPCAQSFPFLNQLQKDYGEQGLQIIGVNLDEKVADADKFLTRYPAEFTITTDPTKQCAKDFDVIAMPSSYLIDREGIVRYIHRGFRPGETKELRLIVEQLLHYQP
ncbi:TlpA family protein disulfide reductase [Nitrosomonas aestuarii]|uniref:TlpA family protein disulfide reductase n=1 Tax=Nitrosomonas aestuarii TaxID=52441 RepID=UPI000D300E38|nr:TlpA disulfide reductase family protein [Nitrosomonas aestuarii]PTN13226.1 peroxiredoxin [Nitrosomonas aestuarii]